jgi:hypothetical protein
MPTTYITPSASFLPPRQVGLVEVSGPHFISVPFKVKYTRDDGVVSQSVSFDKVGTGGSVGDIVDFASILESMFAMGTYPKLEEDQLFCLRCVVINYEKEELVVVGHVFRKEDLQEKKNG